MNDVWLVVAAYNEGSVIKEVLNDALDFFPNIVVVDDGSQDETAASILETGAWCVIHPINLGQGAALQTGITFALSRGASFIATFDADGQHDPKDVVGMVEQMKLSSADVILGSRFKGNTIGMPRIKQLFLRLAVFYTNLTSSVKLTDAHNGLRLFNRKAAMDLRIRQNRMAHASEIIDFIGKMKWVYEEYPVTIKYTDYSIRKGQRMSNSVSIVMDQLLSKFNR
ncbi:glycosyltransferase family 2 protein [Chitiniphilus purpureus]|uniref:Glycosyltransferase family 2 protein n=1 Tax=Chitiniphilus purpureus TaxID=2981137 RepID=A0ABY6DMF4_9NEIS|nr:glycosyltransferase family 2 protein [Chitiniphilus sp. CD1]UXY15539.1 glycosyltransferase family 2 protein [Chitiniphilus sp. CD1]